MMKKHTRAKIKKIFLENLEECGNIKSSAKGAGVDRVTVYRWKNSDLKFAKRFEEALNLGIGALEDEAIHRGHTGVKKPVYYSGKIVGHITEYSDNLLMFMLKSRKPEIYNRDRIELTGKDGLPIQTETKTTVDLSGLTAKQLNALRLFKKSLRKADESEVDDV